MRRAVRARRRGRIAAIAAIAGLSGCGGRGFLTVAELDARADMLDGERVALRGFTLQGLFVLDLRATVLSGGAFYLGESAEAPGGRRVGLPEVAASGDRATLSWTPFLPDAPAYHLVGRLRVDHDPAGRRLSLEALDLEASRQLTEGDDLAHMREAPIPRGTFRCRCWDGWEIAGCTELDCDEGPGFGGPR